MKKLCFCERLYIDNDELFDQRKGYSLIFKRDHCQRYSPLQVPDIARARF